MATDNPRELRAIAQRVEMECDTIIRHGLDAMPAEDQADTIALINDRLALADHILATVREDDGEEQGDVTIRIEDSVTLFCSSTGVIVHYHQPQRRTLIRLRDGRPTRGQFRALCRGLGIEV